MAAAAPPEASASAAPAPRMIEPGWGVGVTTEKDSRVPDLVNGMPVTPELRKLYAGFPALIHLCVCRRTRFWLASSSLTPRIAWQSVEFQRAMLEAV